MSEENSSSNSGIGFIGLLTIVFIYLKLTDGINWSWGWVLSPIWICGIIILLILLALIIVSLVERENE